MKKIVAGLMLVVAVILVIPGYVFSDSVSMSFFKENVGNIYGATKVNITVSIEGCIGATYYKEVHSDNPVLAEGMLHGISGGNYSGGDQSSIENLSQNNWTIRTMGGDNLHFGATNYFVTQIMDSNYNEIAVSDIVGVYITSIELDHYDISVSSPVMPGVSFQVTTTAKNNDDIALNKGDETPLYLSTDAILTPVFADDESLLGTGVLSVMGKTFEGDSLILHLAYTKAEDIKIKIISDNITSITDRITVGARTLSNMDVTVNPSSIISGQSADIMTVLTDRYGNRLKNITVQYTVNKGKGTLDKADKVSDITGKVTAKFYHADITPGVNTIRVTALNLSQDVQINVMVLIYGKKGGTIVASEDPNTQVVIPPDAVSGDVQLMIKTGDELTDEEKTKVCNANDKEEGNMCDDKVRNFECKKDDGSDYGNFDDCVTIEIPYKDDDNDDIVDGTDIRVEDLKVCRLNEETECWEEVNDGGCNEIDRDKKCVRTHVRHFSTYNIGAPSIAGSSEFHVYPNPVNFSKAIRNTMKFENISQGSTVKIYDVTGRLVRSMTGDTNVEWDGKNESGESVGMGLYIYLLTDGNGNKKTGKIGVQK